MEQFNEDLLASEGELRIDKNDSSSLVEMSKWAKFIAITFFTLVGICVLFLIIYGREIMYAFSAYSGLVKDGDAFFATLIITLILAVGVIFITYYFLLNFANKMKTGIETENIDQVNRGLKSLRIHFIIIGILLMLGLLSSLYSMIK